MIFSHFNKFRLEVFMFLEKAGIGKALLPDIFKGERIHAFNFFLEIKKKAVLTHEREYRDSPPLSQWMYKMASTIMLLSRMKKKDIILINNFSKSVWKSSGFTLTDCNVNSGVLSAETFYMIPGNDQSPLDNLVKLFYEKIAFIKMIREGKGRGYVPDHYQWIITAPRVVVLVGLLLLSRIKPKNRTERKCILETITAVEEVLGEEEPLIVKACELARNGL